MTATICRAPAASQRVNNSAISKRAMPPRCEPLSTHGIFNGETIGRTWPKPVGIKAYPTTRPASSARWGKPFASTSAPFRNLVNRWRLELEAAGTVGHRMCIDRLDGNQIVVGGVAQQRGRQKRENNRIVFVPQKRRVNVMGAIPPPRLRLAPRRLSARGNKTKVPDHAMPKILLLCNDPSRLRAHALPSADALKKC